MPEMIAHYEIREKLGESVTSAVYRARDSRSGREAALRVFSGNFTSNSAWVQRLRREARAAAALNHPGICAVYETGEYKGRQYIATEPAEGTPLRETLSGRPLPIEKILQAGIEIADALTAAAAEGIVHGNLTAANIFLNGSGHIKILDFGLARPVSVSEHVRAENNTPDAAEIPSEYLGALRTAYGTYSRLSPEQAFGELPDARSDLFAFGAALYELACGVPAFTSETEAGLFQKILTGAPIPPENLNPELLPRISELILRLLEKDRDLRYQTAADVRADLRRIERDYRLRRKISLENAPSAVSVPDEPARPDKKRGRTKNAAVPQSRFRFLRSPASAVSLLIILAAGGALALLRATAAPEYIPCIEISSFSENDAEADAAPLVSFILRQTLSQFPDIRVLTPEEFENLRKITRERRTAEYEKQPSFLDRINPWRREDYEPAARFTVGVRNVLDNLELQVDGAVRGKKRRIEERFEGTNDFLSRGADSLTKRLLEIWSSGFTARHAENYLTAAQLLSPRGDAISHYFEGARAWERLDIGKAERELRSAIEADPNLAPAHLALGEVRIFQNQWDAAQSEILAARRRAYMLTEADQWRVEALLARVFTKPADERRYFQKVIELQPHKKENFYELAESYFYTADADDAITYYQKALDFDPGYARAWNHVSYCWSWKGDHARAIAAGRKYLELDGSANACDSLGDAYMQAGDYENARAMKLRALALDPQIHYAIRTLAFIDMTQGRFADAENKLRSLVEIADSKAQAAQYYADLAFLHYRAGRLPQAEELCARGLNLLGPEQYGAPHDELLWISGMAALERRGIPAARAALERLRNILDTGSIDAVNYKPVYKYWLYLNAAIAAVEGKKIEAAGYINDLKFIRNKLGYWSTPYDCAFFMDAAGRLYEKMGLVQQAEDSFREAISYNRNFPSAHLRLAALLDRKGARDEARAEIDIFTSIWRDDDGVFPETAEALALVSGF